MAFSRRSLFGGGSGQPAPPTGLIIAARGREALVAESGWQDPVEAAVIPPPADDEIRISSNENPLGPGPRVVAAIDETFEWSFRYPTNTSVNMQAMREALAERAGTEASNILLGAGSGEILKNCAHWRCSEGQPFVTASPSYGDARGVASYFGAEIRDPQVDAAGLIPLDAMAEAAPGASMVYVCNPNNPTATVHPASAIEEFVGRVRQAAPDAVIMIDEAYHEYITDPDYATAIPLALETPNVIVVRTFSKAYGMAGMRIGWATGHRDTIRAMRRYELTFNTNVLGLAGAHAALQDDEFIPGERDRNTAVKEYTVGFFEDAGFEVMDSQTNFFFVNLGRPASEFRSACAEDNVQVGRDFPPLENTHCRISLGTMEEMERAVAVFARVLGVEAPAATAANGL